MKITAALQDSGLAASLSVASKEVKERAAKSVRSASFAVEKLVKILMPVDTGRARASWGHWTPSDIVKPGNWTAKDAHWTVKDDGLTVEQGSNVSYIVRLNEGSSTKAPAGFLDKAAEAGARELTVDIEREIGKALE